MLAPATRYYPQQPVVPQYPGYQHPGYQQPGYQHPGYQQPGYQQPGYQQPGYQYPGYQQPGYQYPGYQQPGYQYPGYQQPGYQQPGYQHPGYQQPGFHGRDEMAFQRLDTDRNQYVSAQEFVAPALQDWNRNPQQAQAQYNRRLQNFQQADTNRDGWLSKAEFLAFKALQRAQQSFNRPRPPQVQPWNQQQQQQLDPFQAINNLLSGIRR